MELNGFKIILASGSPRRNAFFSALGIPFETKIIPVEESYPEHFKSVSIADHIARKKAKPFEKIITKKELVITADTIVWHNEKCLGKPKNNEDAIKMLNTLSGSTHQVITVVGFLTSEKWESIYEISEVTFRKLTLNEITDYVKGGSPLDKAGSYGIQDPFGDAAILSISGSFTNIMGLPLARVINKIQEIVNRS